MPFYGYVVKSEYGDREYTDSYKEALLIKAKLQKNGIAAIILNIDRPQVFTRHGGQAIGPARDVRYMKKGGGSWSTGELAGIVHGAHSEAADATFKLNTLPKTLKKAAQHRLKRDIKTGKRQMIPGYPVESAVKKKIHLRTRHGKRVPR